MLQRTGALKEAIANLLGERRTSRPKTTRPCQSPTWTDDSI
jgi:hypothetical protein